VSTVTIVRDSTTPWQQGLDVIAAMPLAYRGNLGPEDRLAETYSLWAQKTLFNDPTTTQRIDLVRLDPSFADLSPAYHDSVEECFALNGACYVDGEGDITAGDYFWRPPGWVHAAHTDVGFMALLMQEGLSEGDASGPATRHIRSEDYLGRNALHAEPEAAVGPRGWVKRMQTELAAWIPGPVYGRTQSFGGDIDANRLRVKLLSMNWKTDAQSLLVRLEPGYADRDAHTIRSDQLAYVTGGELSVGGENLQRGDFFIRRTGDDALRVQSQTGAELFLKIRGRWETDRKPDSEAPTI